MLYKTYMNQKTTLKEEKIWLSSPHMGGNEQYYIQQAFNENWIAPLGPNVKGFEKDLENYLETDCKVAALASGTAALHLALIKCEVTAGDEVICQSFTFVASANPIMYQRATPVFVDSEVDTWNMCPVALEEALADRKRLGKTVKAIIVVHLYGMPAKMDKILAVANAYNVPVIEDAAEALGSSYKGQKCGTLGFFGVLSFNGNKIITTSGGGALVCADKIVKNQIIHLATQARDEAPHYEHTQVGFNYRMSNITAGIGRGQMEVLADRVVARRRMNTFYRQQFAAVTGITLQQEPSTDFLSNYWLSAIVIDSVEAGIDAEGLRSAFAARNIEVRPLWKPMHLQPVFQQYPYYGTHVAESLFNNGLCLPSGSNLTDGEKQRIVEVIESVLKK